MANAAAWVGAITWATEKPRQSMRTRMSHSESPCWTWVMQVLITAMATSPPTTIRRGP